LNVEEFISPRNKLLFKEGDSPDKIFFVVKGEIEVIHN